MSTRGYEKLDPGQKTSTGPTFQGQKMMPSSPRSRRWLSLSLTLPSSRLTNIFHFFWKVNRWPWLHLSDLLIDDKGELLFADIFHSGRFSTKAATTELQEEMPRFPGDLVAKEYSCRRRLANTLSACCIAEMQCQEESVV